MIYLCSKDSDTESEGHLAEEDEEDADGSAIERSGLAARVSRRDTLNRYMKTIFDFINALVLSCPGSLVNLNLVRKNSFRKTLGDDSTHGDEELTA